jgi:hypothetical protein
VTTGFDRSRRRSGRQPEPRRPGIGSRTPSDGGLGAVNILPAALSAPQVKYHLTMQQSRPRLRLERSDVRLKPSHPQTHNAPTSYPHLSLGAIRNPPPVLSFRATSLRPLGYHNWFKGWLKCVSRGEQVIGNRNHDQRIYGAISYACYKWPGERKYSMDILFEDYPGGGGGGGGGSW